MYGIKNCDASTFYARLNLWKKSYFNLTMIPA